MKPLVVRPKQDRKESTGKHEPKAGKSGKSGEGAASAMEQLIRQEKARVLHKPNEPKDRSSA